MRLFDNITETVDMTSRIYNMTPYEPGCHWISSWAGGSAQCQPVGIAGDYPLL